MTSLGKSFDMPLGDPIAVPPKPDLTAVAGAARPGEITAVHTHLIRLPLGVEESRAYWASVDPSVPLAERAVVAFEQRWFGAKSFERVRLLLAGFALRFDAYPEALAVLRRWPDMDAQTRRVICHWHLQLTDPIYRTFSGTFLARRRDGLESAVTRDVVFRWVQRTYADRWAISTCAQVATKLLSAAAEAGLVSPQRDPRRLLPPKLPDVAVAYLLYLLHGLRFEGTLLENPYLGSVDLTQGFLEQRLRRLPGLAFRRMGELTEIDWIAPDLNGWADLALGDAP